MSERLLLELHDFAVVGLGRTIVPCGEDAHGSVDLAAPRTNQQTAGGNTQLTVDRYPDREIVIARSDRAPFQLASPNNWATQPIFEQRISEWILQPVQGMPYHWQFERGLLRPGLAPVDAAHVFLEALAKICIHRDQRHS